MRIGVLSDTHDRLDTLRRALDLFQQRGVSVLFHPGDVVAPFTAKLLAAFPGTVHITYGNNDGERRGLKALLPQIQDGPQFVELAGRRILLHHALEWCVPAELARADVVLTGHTHEAAFENRDGKLLLNPGECCGWVTGRASAAILDLTRGSVEWIELRP